MSSCSSISNDPDFDISEILKFVRNGARAKWEEKWGQRGAKWQRESGCFSHGYNELYFFPNGTDQHEIPAENVNGCAALLKLNRRI